MVKIPVKRLMELPDLDRHFLPAIYKEVIREPRDGKWRRWEGSIDYDGQNFQVKCDFKFDENMFQYRELDISRGLTQTVWLN